MRGRAGVVVGNHGVAGPAACVCGNYIGGTGKIFKKIRNSL